MNNRYPKDKLDGSVIWISGGASGMGAAAAKLLAGCGAKVTIADVQSDLAHQTAREIHDNDGTCHVDVCDIRDEQQVALSIETTANELGPPQSLINCAGIFHVCPLHEYSSADWDSLMGVNLKSVFFSFKFGWPHLRTHRRSYMVNVGSIGSFTGQELTPSYNTSKAAVLQLTRGIALDYAAKGLRCNCVCPGITDTPMLQHHLSKICDGEGILQKRLRRVPMGVIMTPEMMARAILYLCCEDSAGVTGTSLVVDGGYLAASEWESPAQTAFMDQ